MYYTKRTNMKLKLTRDEARAIQQNFFPYMMQVCDMQIRQTQYNEGENMIFRIIRCIVFDIIRKFDLKLIGFANKFQFDLKEREAIVMYRMLLSQPIDQKNVWMQNLRDRVVAILYQQLNNPGQIYKPAS